MLTMETGVRGCDEARCLVIGTATTITVLVVEVVAVVVVDDDWFNLTGLFDWARSDLTGSFD